MLWTSVACAEDYLRAAGTLYKNGELADAAVYLEAALKKQPNCQDCWQLLGYCHYNLGEFAKALQAYRKMLELSPGRDDVRRLIQEIEQEIKSAEKDKSNRRETVRRRRSGWGAILGVPSGVTFARRLQDMYIVTLMLGSRFDNQIALSADMFARFSLEESGVTYISFGLGWCTMAGGSETVGITETGKILKVARQTRAGPNIPLAVSYFFGGTEFFLQGSAMIEITPEYKLVPGGGLGVRWYIE